MFLARVFLGLLLLSGQRAWADAWSTVAPFTSQSTVTAAGGTTAATLAATVPISVLHFGAKCDNATDDSAAFQAAANLGRRISVPAGICRINSTITIVNGTQFVGQGRPLQYTFAPTTGTTLDFFGAAGGANGFEVSGGGTVQMARFADMQIQRAPGAALAIKAVYFTLDNVTLAYNGGNGATLTNTYLTTIRGSLFELNGGAGLVVTSGSTTCLVSSSCYTTVQITNSEADTNTGDGWQILNQDTTTFANSGADHNGGYGYNAKFSSVVFQSSDAENNGKSGYYFYGSRVHMVGAKGAVNNTTATAGEANHTLADQGSSVQIDSSLDFLSSTAYSLNATNSSNITQNTNNRWVATQNADGTSFVGNYAGTVTYKPTAMISFNNAAGANAYGLYGDTANSIVNVATGGTVSFRVNNVTVASVNASRFTFNVPATDQSQVVQTSGASYTVAAAIGRVILDGVNATYTLTMPASPADGQLVLVECGSAVTALTVSANTGQTMKGAPSACSTTQGHSFHYRTANTAWYMDY